MTMEDRLLINICRITAIAASCLLVAAAVSAAPPAKEDVCHAPPEDPLNTQYIQVGAKGGAVSAHLNHGDWLVTEEMCDAIPDNDCDGAPDPAADDADCVAQLGFGATCISGVCEPPAPDTPIGTITADILRGGIPPGSDRGVESQAGNLVADAQQWQTSANGAEIAFMNPGGVRSDLTFAQSGTEGDGVVTFGEAFTFQPFNNTLVTYQMTGAEIISALEEQCQPAFTSRPFLHLGVSSGFTYDLSKTIVAGQCTGITVSNVKLSGVNLNPLGAYIVTVNSFLADGGDNFDTFGMVTSPRIDGGIDLQALINYLGTFGPVAPPNTDRVNEL